jgi:hypothetical protein
MRGESSGQHEAFSYGSLGERIPVDHPLRTARVRAEAALKRLYRQSTAIPAIVSAFLLASIFHGREPVNALQARKCRERGSLGHSA